MTIRIAHLSDLHFGRRVCLDMIDAIKADLGVQAPKLVVVTGDMTDRGRISEFRWARDFLTSLKIPFMTVPGNREVSISAFWEWMFPRFAMGRYSRFFGESDTILIRIEEAKLALLGLNSVHPFPSWPGSLARASRYWLKEQAAALKDYRKVLLVHHPVIPVIGASSFWAHSFSDAGEVLNICSRTGIGLILQGHKHRSAVMELNVPARNSRLVVSAAGAPLRAEWDSAYHVIDLLPTETVVTPRHFVDGRFVANGTYRFPCLG
jgi:3',5'-cyclic AMP phosphodiesterase CpdA